MLEQTTNQLLAVDDQTLVRIGTDEWSGHTLLDVTTVQDASQPEPLASLILDEWLPPTDPPIQPWLLVARNDGAFVYVSFLVGERIDMMAIDVSELTNPRVIGVYPNQGSPVAAHGSTVVTQDRSGSLWLVDASTPSLAPSPLDLPASNGAEPRASMLLSVTDDEVTVRDTYELEPFEVIRQKVRLGGRLLVIASPIMGDRGTGRLLVLDGFDGAGWLSAGSLPAATDTLLANGRYAIAHSGYPFGCMPTVFDLSEALQSLEELSKPRTCSPCAGSVALVGTHLVTTHEGSVQVVSLEQYDGSPRGQSQETQRWVSGSQ